MFTGTIIENENGGSVRRMENMRLSVYYMVKVMNCDLPCRNLITLIAIKQ